MCSLGRAVVVVVLCVENFVIIAFLQASCHQLCAGTQTVAQGCRTTEPDMARQHAQITSIMSDSSTGMSNN